MKHSARTLFSIIVIATLFLSALAMLPVGARSTRGPAPIYVESGAFIPKSDTAALQAAAANGNKYYIVQFAGPIEEAWKQAAAAEGAEILDYIPDFAFKMRMNGGAAQNISQMSFVTAVVPVERKFKFHKDLLKDGETRIYRVRIEKGADLAEARALVKKTGAEVLSFDGETAFIAANSAIIDLVADVMDVASIENFYLNQTFITKSGPARNDVGAGSIIGANAANARGYDGSSQTVAVADTGLGGGSAATAHVDIPAGRVTAIYNWPGTTDSCFQTITDDGAVDVDCHPLVL